MKLPCVVLEKDNWDDFGYRTTFVVSIFGANRRLLHSGTIKILQNGSNSTTLPAEFDFLPDNYCALWQDLSDYETINRLSTADEILNGLNDVNYNLILRMRFMDNPCMTDSLRRFSEAQRAFLEGLNVLGKSTVEGDFSFSYDEDDSSPTPFGTLDFKFSKKLKGIYRVVGVIGRNGVGKTTLLANMAMKLSGMKKIPSSLSHRPGFNKVIAVSYSTFDDFYRPQKNERTFSYHYCGIRGEEENEILTKDEMSGAFLKSFKRIRNDSDKLSRWKNCMNILYLNSMHNYFPDLDRIMPSFHALSSGQKIMTMSFTQIIDVIALNSLLLFDEPENHLHPNGQNTLFKCLDYLLNEYDSFALLSTHSPIFIQNIPRSNVIKLRSTGGIRFAEMLTIESFGQHFSKLTEEIFGFSEDNLFFVEKLKTLYNDRDNQGQDFLQLKNFDSVGAIYHLRNFENDAEC